MKLLGHKSVALLVAALLTAPPVLAGGFTFHVTVKGVPAPVISTPPSTQQACRAGMTLVSSRTLSYNGQSHYDGTPQPVAVPSGATCADVIVDGAGGGGGSTDNAGVGGSGDQVTGRIPLTGISTLTVLVGGGAGSGGGGGLSGIFSTTPAASSALVIAGGGGGGYGQSGYDGAFTPQQPSEQSTPGGMGFGGSGKSSSNDGTPFGDGSPHGYFDFPGGYGGGAAPYYGNGGGSGMPGGSGNSCTSNPCSPGGGGTSYCSSIVQNCTDAPGAGGAGRSAYGDNGSVVISFYK